MGVTAEAFLLRGLLWFAIASLGMVPYFLALRRLRVLIAADPFSASLSTVALLDHHQVDPIRENARQVCRRRLVIGVVIYFSCAPLLPLIYNA